jgi:hypothetical protein
MGDALLTFGEQDKRVASPWRHIAIIQTLTGRLEVRDVLHPPRDARISVLLRTKVRRSHSTRGDATTADCDVTLRTLGAAAWPSMALVTCLNSTR